MEAGRGRDVGMVGRDVFFGEPGRLEPPFLCSFESEGTFPGASPSLMRLPGAGRELVLELLDVALDRNDMPLPLP